MKAPRPINRNLWQLVGVLLCASITCAACFLHIFILSPQVQNPWATAPDLKPVPAVNKRVLFVLADAMRADRAFDEASMPFLAKQRHLGAWGIARPRLPTLTGSAVTTLGTGRWTTLADVTDNFEAPPSRSDNLFRRLHEAERPVGFIGDAAWVHRFGAWGDDIASFGDHGIADTHDSDDKALVALNKWFADGAKHDMIVLHLVGADHEGHAHGTAGKGRYATRLKEIDAALKKINEQLPPDMSMLVIADHGMTDSGGHGGGEEETRAAPFVWWGPGIKKVSNVQMEQAAIAPTLAAYLGVYPPAESAEPATTSILNLSPKDAAQVEENRRKQWRAVSAREDGSPMPSKLPGQWIAWSLLLGMFVLLGTTGQRLTSSTTPHPSKNSPSPQSPHPLWQSLAPLLLLPLVGVLPSLWGALLASSLGVCIAWMSWGNPLKKPPRLEQDSNPKKQTPKERTPKEQTPKEQTPKEQTPKERIPKERTSKERIPKERTPKERIPKERTPKERTLKERTSKERTSAALGLMLLGGVLASLLPVLRWWPGHVWGYGVFCVALTFGFFGRYWSRVSLSISWRLLVMLGSVGVLAILWKVHEGVEFHRIDGGLWGVLGPVIGALLIARKQRLLGFSWGVLSILEWFLKLGWWTTGMLWVTPLLVLWVARRRSASGIVGGLLLVASLLYGDAQLLVLVLVSFLVLGWSRLPVPRRVGVWLGGVPLVITLFEAVLYLGLGKEYSFSAIQVALAFTGDAELELVRAVIFVALGDIVPWTILLVVLGGWAKRGGAQVFRATMGAALLSLPLRLWGVVVGFLYFQQSFWLTSSAIPFIGASLALILATPLMLALATQTATRPSESSSEAAQGGVG